MAKQRFKWIFAKKSNSIIEKININEIEIYQNDINIKSNL